MRLRFSYTIMKNASVLHKYAAGKRMVLHQHRLRRRKVMSFDYIRKLPTPDEIRGAVSGSGFSGSIKQKRDAEIRDVLTGKSDKLLVIIGPLLCR